MPSATAKGFPYPLDTDPVNQGDDSIKALADKLETAVPFAMAAGVLNTAALAINAGVGTAVTFPAGRFSVIPCVAVSHDSNGYTFALAAGTTAGGTTLRAFNPSGAATSGTGVIRYVAVQMTPTSGPG
jgi:hypothetical protein